MPKHFTVLVPGTQLEFQCNFLNENQWETAFKHRPTGKEHKIDFVISTNRLIKTLKALNIKLK